MNEDKNIKVTLESGWTANLLLIGLGLKKAKELFGYDFVGETKDERDTKTS